MPKYTYAVEVMDDDSDGWRTEECGFWIRAEAEDFMERERQHYRETLQWRIVRVLEHDQETFA